MNPLAVEPKTRTLVVGLGSFHGDDQAGWKAIDQLEREQMPSVELRKALLPLDLLDWIDLNCRLHLIDACTREELDDQFEKETHFRFELMARDHFTAPGLRFRYASPLNATDQALEPARLRSGGSHQIDVLTVLELSARFENLPKQVIIWCIPGCCFAAGEAISPECELAISRCVAQLSQELPSFINQN
jgi:Ni,Fe-hydrogenase maturation factor